MKKSVFMFITLFLIIILAVGVIVPGEISSADGNASSSSGGGGGSTETPSAGGGSSGGGGGGSSEAPSSSSGGGGGGGTYVNITCSTNDDCPSVSGEQYCDGSNLCGSVSVYSCVNDECIPSGGGVGCRVCPNGCENEACIIDEETSERVKCIFDDSTRKQKCYTAETNPRASCSGVESYVTNILGDQGEEITWKSTCGGYASTVIDGENEYAKFSCGEITDPICGNEICEPGEGLTCIVPETVCEEGKTCSTKRGRCTWGCAKDCRDIPRLNGRYDEKFKLHVNQEVKFKDPLLKIKLNTIIAPRRCAPVPMTRYSRTCTYKWDAQVMNQTVTIRAVVKDVKGEEASDSREVDVVEELNGSVGSGGGGGSGNILHVQIIEPSSSVIEAREQTIKVTAKGPNKIKSLDVYVDEGAGAFSDEICVDSAAGGGGSGGGDVPAVTTETIEKKSRVTAQYIIGKVIEEEPSAGGGGGSSGGGSSEAPSAGGGGGGGGGSSCIYGLPIAVLQVKNYEGRRQRTEVVKIKLNEKKKVFDKVISFLDYDRKTRQGVFLVSLISEDPSFECMENCICDAEGNIIECVIEVEECVSGTILCPDGVCRKECEITDQTAECDFGCFYEEKCLPYGLRVNKLYCDLSGDMKTQFSAKESCDNNFECSSNLCIDGECVSGSLFRRVMSWFRRWFRK